MKKVCIIATENSLYDGRVYWREAVSLVKNNYDVTYIGIDDESNEKKNGVTKENIKYYKICLKSKLYFNIFSNKVYEEYGYCKNRFDNIFSILEKETYDIIHMHGLYSIFMISKIKKIMPQVKIIYECREYYPDAIRDYNKTKGIKTINKYLYSYYFDILEKIKASESDKIIVTDDSIYNRFRKIVGNKVTIVYNFSDMVNNSVEGNSTKKYDLIYCGGITKVRGILQIIKAVKIAKDEGYELKCLLVGPIREPELENEIKKYIDTNNLKNNIIITGEVSYDKIPLYLQKSKIGLVTLMPIPKYKKNIPMKQFEYMTYGLPIVGSDLPPIKKFVNEADSGLIINPEDEYSIWKAVKELLTNEQLYNKFSKNGIYAAKNRYSWKISEQKLLSVYNEL